MRQLHTWSCHVGNVMLLTVIVVDSLLKVTLARPVQAAVTVLQAY